LNDRRNASICEAVDSGGFSSGSWEGGKNRVPNRLFFVIFLKGMKSKNWSSLF